MTFEEALKDIKELYPHRLLLSNKETSILLERSMHSLRRDRERASGMRYKQVSQGGKVQYPVREVAKWISDTVETI